MNDQQQDIRQTPVKQGVQAVSPQANKIGPATPYDFDGRNLTAYGGLLPIGMKSCRLATSVRQGTVTASLMLRKLGSYPRRNGLAAALCELGRIERSVFTLDRLQNDEFRRRVHAGVNKGATRNALARAVFFKRLGERRDRSFENQRYRASGLNLVTPLSFSETPPIWNGRSRRSKDHGETVDETLWQHVPPLGWEAHQPDRNTVWRQDRRVEKGKFRPLRPFPQA